MMLSSGDAKAIADRLLARSKADACIVKIEGSDGANLRFARGNATTDGATSKLTVRVESHFGKRAGVAQVSGLDADALAAAVARSEEIARLSPENPELMPPLGPQAYDAGAGYDSATAAVGTDRLAAATKPVIAAAGSRDVDVAGYAATQHAFTAVATSAGLFAHEPRTAAEFTMTARNRAGTWSGWAGVAETRFGRLDVARIGQRAIEKGAHESAPIALDPGKYTVILEPSAVCDLVGWMLWYMGARFADEGRSFFSRKGGGNRIGEKLFADGVTILSDPADPVAPEPTFADSGLPRHRTVWAEAGELKNLTYPRFWAQKTGHAPIPRPRGFVMAGGTATVEDMVRDTKRGVLVTRLWYIRMLDPQKLVLTGLTRDGNFYIENGRIVGPANNFRFNESPVAMLANVLAL
ncbi:MAG TPA: metallopeptidase TldD-related protein, partial [Xanthobacteraceae bacterium]|nr:metallopeptidase TldD-related protein [Xanthobacteraceae bacterium]